jgi:hypothetical protein
VFVGVEVGWIVFIIVEAELLNCINCNPVPARNPGSILDEASKKFASFWMTRGFQLNLHFLIRGRFLRVVLQYLSNTEIGKHTIDQRSSDWAFFSLLNHALHFSVRFR